MMLAVEQLSICRLRMRISIKKKIIRNGKFSNLDDFHDCYISFSVSGTKMYNQNIA